MKFKNNNNSSNHFLHLFGIHAKSTVILDSNNNFEKIGYNFLCYNTHMIIFRKRKSEYRKSRTFHSMVKKECGPMDRTGSVCKEV